VIIVLAFFPRLMMPLFLVPMLMLFVRTMGINRMVVLFQMEWLMVNSTCVVVIGIQSSIMMVGRVPPIK